MPVIQNEDAAWGDLDWGAAAELESPAPPDSPPVVAKAEPPVAQILPSAGPPPIEKAPEPEVKQDKGVEASLAKHSAPPAFQEPENAPRQNASEPVLRDSDRPVKTKRMVFTPSSVATLTMRNESGEETSFTVSRDLTIGRHASNDLVIQDLHVSGHHAKLSRRSDGQFEITDLNSSGGTFVNGIEIKNQRLSSGDEIVFSTVAATFRYVAGNQADSELFAGGTLVKPKREIAKQAAALKAGSPPARMTVHLPKGKRQAFTVDLKGALAVGRAADNDVIIPDEHVSGHHARLICTTDGGIEVIDLTSTCGTFVNGVEIQSSFARIGDRLRFGVVDCTLEPGTPELPRVEKKGEPTIKKAHSPMQMVFPAPESNSGS